QCRDRLGLGGRTGLLRTGGHQFAPENSRRRLTIARAAALTSRVMTKSTRPEAMSAFTASPDDSGNCSAMLAAIVDGLFELIRLTVTAPDTESTMATAIVSPSARPSPSIAPLTTPERPNGSTAIRIISQRVAPSASAASSCSFGVWRKTSRDTAVMIGRIITASTRPATSIVRPVADTGPAKNGNQPNHWLSQVERPTEAGPRTAAPHRP